MKHERTNIVPITAIIMYTTRLVSFKSPHEQLTSGSLKSHLASSRALAAAGSSSFLASGVAAAAALWRAFGSCDGNIDSMNCSTCLESALESHCERNYSYLAACDADLEEVGILWCVLLVYLPDKTGEDFANFLEVLR